MLLLVMSLILTLFEHFVLEGFIVQLRSLDDHLPLPGITVGDIGMKFGNGAYNTMDNGVMRFDHVRIPRDQMLMRLVILTFQNVSHIICSSYCVLLVLLS